MEHLNVIMERLLQILPPYEHRLYAYTADFSLSFTSKYGISPGTALSIALGCVCVYMFAKRRWGWGSTTRRFLHRSKSLAELYGGELALRRINDYREAQTVPATLDNAEVLLEALLQEEHIDLQKLQSTAAKLEMGGGEERAVRILEDAKKRHRGKLHQVYEIDMLLAEMLIYKGDFEKALKCDCLNSEEIKDDARRPLYKAVIYGMREKWEEAKACWEEFVEIRSKFLETNTTDGAFPLARNFEMFKGRVTELRSEILKAGNKKPRM